MWQFVKPDVPDMNGVVTSVVLLKRKLEEVLDVPREIITGEVTEYAEAFIAGNMTLEEAYKGACDRSNYVFERSWDEACIYKYNGQIKFLDDYMKHYKISKPGNQMYINNIFVVC